MAQLIIENTSPSTGKTCFSWSYITSLLCCSTERGRFVDDIFSHSGSSVKTAPFSEQKQPIFHMRGRIDLMQQSYTEAVFCLVCLSVTRINRWCSCMGCWTFPLSSPSRTRRSSVWLEPFFFQRFVIRHVLLTNCLRHMTSRVCVWGGGGCNLRTRWWCNWSPN